MAKDLDGDKPELARLLSELAVAVQDAPETQAPKTQEDGRTYPVHDSPIQDDIQTCSVHGSPIEDDISLGMITTSADDPIRHSVEADSTYKPTPGFSPPEDVTWSGGKFRASMVQITIPDKKTRIDTLNKRYNPREGAHDSLKESYFGDQKIYLITGYIRMGGLIFSQDEKTFKAEQEDMIVLIELQRIYFKFGRGPESAHLKEMGFWRCIGKLDWKPPLKKQLEILLRR